MADQTASRAQAAASGAVPSIISHDVKIVGNLISEGEVQIDGRIEGDVQSRTVTVGEDAVIEGAVYADEARVYGTINGAIDAASVALLRTARVTGDINHAKLSIETGANVDGRLSRRDKSAAASANPFPGRAGRAS